MKTTEELDQLAKDMRDNAVATLDRILKIPKGYSSNTSRIFVEQIISATILKVASIQSQVTEEPD